MESSATEKKLKKRPGGHYYRKKKAAEEALRVSEKGSAASQFSADDQVVIEDDAFTVLSRHGFFGELVSYNDAIKDNTLKEIGNDVLKAGLLAMKPGEVLAQCVKWVEQRVVPSYLWMIQNKEEEDAKKILDKMSAVDHINAILKLLPRHYNQERALYSLCNSFHDNAKLLTLDELKFWTNGYVDGMQQLAKQVLNLGVTESQLNRYKVVALLFRLGQAEEILAMISRFSFKEVNWKKYHF